MAERIKRILVIIISFSVAFLFVALAWFLLDAGFFIRLGNGIENYPNSLSDFLLYLIGYGDIAVYSTGLKIFITMFSVLLLALLSSVLTVSLFEWQEKLKINPSAVLYKNAYDEIYGLFVISTRQRDLYDVKITLHLTVANSNYEVEKTIAYLPKNKSFPIVFKAEFGSVLYRFLKSYADNKTENTLLVCMVSYVDSKNGQNYISCKEFKLFPENGSNCIYPVLEIIDINGKKELPSFLKQLKTKAVALKTFDDSFCSDDYVFDLSLANKICSENIKMSFENNNTVIKGDVKFSSETRNPDAFGMIVLDNPYTKDWVLFKEFNGILCFDTFVEGDITLLFEFKKLDGSLIVKRIPEFKSNGEWQHFEYQLSQLSDDDLCDVKELCFTVKDTSYLRKGAFKIKNLEISCNDRK